MKWVGRLILLFYCIIVMPALIILMGSMTCGMIVEGIKYFQMK